MMFAPKDTQTYKPAAVDNFALHYRYGLSAEKKKGKYSFKLPQTMSMPTAGQKLIQRLQARQDAQIESLKRLYTVRMFEATVDWRLIVGLGAEHVQETNMTLHHVYGIPYIPGSAVKGVLNHWALPDEEKTGEHLKQVHERIFGSQEQKGSVIFMDAFPVGDVTFALDIMNPHYPDYYGKDRYPTDDQNPNPVTFLTVEKTRFRFVLLSKDKPALKQVVAWLEEAFECAGFGAKTAVGYGYFRDVREITEASENSDTLTTGLPETPKVQLSAVEVLCVELSTLTNVNRSYEIYNNELGKFSGDELIQLADALRVYWQKVGKWKGGSKNQRAKVRHLKTILGID